MPDDQGRGEHNGAAGGVDATLGVKGRTPEVYHSLVVGAGGGSQGHEGGDCFRDGPQSIAQSAP